MLSLWYYGHVAVVVVVGVVVVVVVASPVDSEYIRTHCSSSSSSELSRLRIHTDTLQ